MRTTSQLTLTAALVALVGCGGGRSQPEFGQLIPVAGTVTEGGKPVSGGSVQFTPDPDKGEFIVNSAVGSDGKFSLNTIRATDSAGERKPGVAAGKYKVMYTPPLGDQAASGAPEPVTAPSSINIAGPETDLKVNLPERKKK